MIPVVWYTAAYAFIVLLVGPIRRTFTCLSYYIEALIIWTVNTNLSVFIVMWTFRAFYTLAVVNERSLQRTGDAFFIIRVIQSAFRALYTYLCIKIPKFRLFTYNTFRSSIQRQIGRTNTRTRHRVINIRIWTRLTPTRVFIPKVRIITANTFVIC